MRAGGDCSICCLPARHQCSTLIEVIANRAHVGMHLIRTAVVGGPPDYSFIYGR